VAWQDDTESSVLDADVVVVRVVSRGGSWKVESSHGDPGAKIFTVRDQAKAHAQQFAGSLIDRSLLQLAELEGQDESPSNGWSPRPCALIAIHIPPSPRFVDAYDGEVIVEMFDAERSKAIDDARARLQAAKAAVGKKRR
jgi:hypothetical protein